MGKSSQSCCCHTHKWMQKSAVQAWGTLLNISSLLFRLAAMGQNGPSYSPASLSITWRVSYGLGLVPVAYMVFHRLFYLKESEVWKVSCPVWAHSQAGFIARIRLAVKNKVIGASMHFCSLPYLSCKLNANHVHTIAWSPNHQTNERVQSAKCQLIPKCTQQSTGTLIFLVRKHCVLRAPSCVSEVM